jgi:TPR repeat protein
MSDWRPMLRRFSTYVVSFVLLVFLVVPAWANYQAGMDAYDRGDYVTAFREWQPLAVQGDAEAQTSLGTMYSAGHGVPQDFQQALFWFRLAAKQGYAMACTKLGLLYERGNGVTQDAVLAQAWYILGAARGDRLGAEYRDALAKQMTPVELFRAQEQAREWRRRSK